MVLGVATVQLCKYPQDTCTRLSLGLEHGVEGEVQEGVLSAILWVTGGDTAGDGPQNYPDRAETADRFGLFRTLEDIESVGTLTVTVVEAAGLGLSKLQGSVNPFCVLEMDNQFHRTRTMTKTKVPVWDRTFHFHVRDPFTVLRLAVISEKINSPQGNTELILGRASLLVSSLHSTGGHTQDMWINLKDRKLRKPAKGENPRIHLRVSYIHNKIRAAVAVFWNPEEKLYEVEKPKFERSTLLRNVSRIKGFLPKGSTIQKLKQSYTDIIAWKEPARTVKFFIFYMFFVYYFQIWWIPAATLYQLITNYRNRRTHHYQPSMVPRLESMEEEEEEEEDKEEKKSIKQSIDSFQNTLQEFQECCGLVASYLEKVSNMAHFQEVFLSCLFCMVLLVASLILYILGLRSVLLLWGVNKFTKKLRESDPVPTNEIDNLILRVPDYELLEDCRDVFPSSGSPSPS